MNKSIDFPQYRKLSNGLRMYRINSSKDFDEIQLLGEKVYHFFIEAKQYPEMLRIMDMIDPENISYQELDPEMWENFFEKRNA